MINLPTKFEVAISAQYENNEKGYKMWKLWDQKQFDKSESDRSLGLSFVARNFEN